MCDMHLVIFRSKKYKTEYRTSTNRTESGEMCDMHLVIFSGKETAVGNSRSFLTNLPFHDFSKRCEPLIVVEILGKIVKRKVCQKRG